MEGRYDMIEVREVASKKDRKTFVNFPLKLYKGNPNYIPCFYAEEMKLFDKETNIYSDYTDSHFFLAFKDGKPAGRLALIISYPYIEQSGLHHARFSRFDVIDDLEVTKALFAAAFEIAKRYGIDHLQGPLGYNDQDKEGLLIYGFDQPACYGGIYNYEYYSRHLEALGFTKQEDWLERKITPPKQVDPKLAKMADLVEQRYKLRDAVKNDTPAKEIVKRYGAKIFDLMNKACAHLLGWVPLTPRVRDEMLSSLGLIFDPRLISVIVDEKDNVVGFGVVFPCIWHAMNKCGGKLFPFGVFRLLHAVKHFDEVELALISVDPEWKNRGVYALVVRRIMQNIIDMGVKSVETNGTLETNFPINNLWEQFEHVKHKRRRCYIAAIPGAEVRSEAEAAAAESV